MSLVTLTPDQIDAISVRITATCTSIEVKRWPGGRWVEVNTFQRTRLIESVKISPGGKVTVLS